MRSKLVIANWKMNGSSAFLAEMADGLKAGIASGINAVNHVVVCPPTVYISDLSDALKSSSIEIGAQNVSEHAPGAFTGEVSTSMLADAGCSWIIVGHSERRALFSESSELVAKKAQQVLAAGLNAVVCIGETLEQRQSGETEKVITSQLKPVLELENLEQYVDQLVLAYEPVWAIGTGETASPDQAQHVHQFIREQLGESLANVSILYGGSVKPENAAELFAESDIDGGLIGGASLNSEDFLNICRAMPD